MATYSCNQSSKVTKLKPNQNGQIEARLRAKDKQTNMFNRHQSEISKNGAITTQKKGHESWHA